MLQQRPGSSHRVVRSTRPDPESLPVARLSPTHGTHRHETFQRDHLPARFRRAVAGYLVPDTLQAPSESEAPGHTSWAPILRERSCQSQRGHRALDSGDDQLHEAISAENDGGEAARDDREKKCSCDGVFHGELPFQSRPLLRQECSSSNEAAVWSCEHDATADDVGNPALHVPRAWSHGSTFRPQVLHA
jgi:hypothetical protein